MLRLVGVAAAALAAMLSSCASAQPEAGRGLTSTAIPTFTAPITTSGDATPGPVRTTTIVATCKDRPWAFGFTPVEPASGNRYLSVQLRNCSDRTMSVPDTPKITVRDSDAKPVAVQWDWRPSVESRDVAAGRDIYLRLHWLSSGRCERGGATLEIAVSQFSTARLADCLQLGGLPDVTGEPPRGDAQWASAP